MYKVGVFTGTRAEYGLLKPLIEKINQDCELELCLIVTGSHLEEKFGDTYREIVEDGYPIAYQIPMDLVSDTPREICISMSRELAGLADAFEQAKPDLLLLLGDRYETFIAAATAMMFCIPVAHLHGGEITEGLLDDSIRHSISKMSALHFVSTEVHSRRLKQMGEEPERIWNVGALGVENIKRVKYLSRDELCNMYSPLFREPYILITYHPVTLEKGMARIQFEDFLHVISQRKEYNYIFTYANADAEGNEINQLINSYVEHNANACAFKSLGQVGYLSALKYACCVAGNSSSGIIEAPSFHIPTINIGNRQKGRECSQTVISCGYSAREINEAFEQALSEAFTDRCKYYPNPYEGKDTSDQIIQIVKNKLSTGITLKKRFMDAQGD
ncbi:MAG: UDP-N-acetylglucosamine 2-epimerase (hydrolyzing) [Lachnospiraceae bacterium]|nr:UDP-N-acetylglucosamine 2-epimerase (hydrolyzing) [Lachnospiraceae bacterium]